MKLKQVFVYALLIINILFVSFAPRFGWILRDLNNQYKYTGRQYTNDQTAVTYKSSDSVIEIRYPNRFSRVLELKTDKEEAYTIKVNIDGGIYGTFSLPQQSALYNALSDIIWKDLSGIFYYRYILIIGAVFGYVICLKRSNLSVRSFYFAAGIVLFVFSSLVSLRIVF